MIKIIFITYLSILAGSALSIDMAEEEARRLLNEAGITILPPTPYVSPWPCSSLKKTSNGTFRLYLRDDHLTNIAVLARIPVSDLDLHTPQLRDLSPLNSLTLDRVTLWCHPDADVTFLGRKHIHSLDISRLPVRNLSFLQGMSIEELWFNPYIVTNGLDLLTTQATNLNYISTCIGDWECNQWTRKGFQTKLRIWGFRPDSEGTVPDRHAINSTPVSLCMTADGGGMTAHGGGAKSWELTVETNGTAVLMIPGKGSLFDTITATWKLSAAQYASMRMCIADNSFFSLDSSYGDHLVDVLGSRTLCVRAGAYQKTVGILSFRNLLSKNNPKNEARRRLLKIWHAAQSLVKLPEECVSFDEEDEKVLNPSSYGSYSDPPTILVEASTNVLDDPQFAKEFFTSGICGSNSLYPGDSFVLEQKGRRQSWLVVSMEGTNVVVKKMGTVSTGALKSE